MAVAIIYDPAAEAAALYCTTTGFAFGPIFEHDAQAKAEAFVEWFRTGDAAQAARQLRISTLHGRLDDPRDYFEGDLKALLGAWQAEALDDDGELRAA